MKRTIDILVISDLKLSDSVHKLEQLYQYLKGIQPKTLVIIGKIIDHRSYPLRKKNNIVINILQQLLAMSMKGTKIYYITDSEDKVLRSFTGAKLGNIEIRESLLLCLSGKKYWIVHENYFRDEKKSISFLSKIGNRINRSVDNIINQVTTLFTNNKNTSEQKEVDDSTIYPDAIFEKNFAIKAMKRNYDAIITACGYRPKIKDISLIDSTVSYMNSGKWSKHLTALENTHGRWKIYTYDSMHYGLPNPKLGIKKIPSMKSPAPFYENQAVKEIQL